jgi:lantibiotic biosynthesis protein
VLRFHFRVPFQHDVMSAMSDKVTEFRVAGPILVRAPLLAASRLHAWSKGLECSTLQMGQLEDAAILADRAILRARLVEWIREPAIREAIYVASPSLFSRLDKWVTNLESKDAAKVENSVVRYLGRMSARCTPFGLFAGFALGARGEETKLDGFGTQSAQRNVRPDMGFLCMLAELLAVDVDLKEHIKFKPNASMYEVVGRLHVPVLGLGASGIKRYELVGVEPDEALRKVLKRASAEQGATRAELAFVVRGKGVSSDEANAYVEELIASRILESALEPPITGDDPLASLTEVVRSSNREHTALAKLESVATALRQLRTEPLGCDAARYETIGKTLKDLGGQGDSLFQVDLSYVNTPVLGEDVLREVKRGVELLYRMSPTDDTLREFRTAFSERYEGREVSMLEALDDEVGIGFVDDRAYTREPAPLLEGLGLRAGRGSDKPSPDVRAFEGLLIEKLEHAWREGLHAIEITEADAKRIDSGSLSGLPDSFSAFVSVLREGESHKVLMNGWFGPSAARLLGRFSAWNSELATQMREHMQLEESLKPEAVFAEIVHMPDASRAANVLLRPVLRKYEIAFCGRSGALPENVISPTDLLVSVVGNRVVLRSRKLGKEVIPRLTSAHNFLGRQLSVYRFLAAVQNQNVRSAGAFSWGTFSNARFLPRVTSGNLILSPARYTLNEAELKTLTTAVTAGARYRAVATLRKTHTLPKYVGLEDGDNILPVDLDNGLSIDAFVSTLAKRKQLTLVELFLDSERLAACGPEGLFTNEVLVPFIRTEGRSHATLSETRTPTTQRAFPPGSEWLYVKIYCSRGSVDDILRGPITQTLEAARGLYDQWFFLRYDDPHSHLRIRFHGEAKVLSGELLPILTKQLRSHIASGRVRKVVLDTYERELERYGGDNAMSLVERFFWEDSKAAVDLVRLLSSTEGKDRWLYALSGMHRLLEAFGFEAQIRDGLILRDRDSFQHEMGFTDDQKHRLADRYRNVAALTTAALDGRGLSDEARAVFDRRFESQRKLAKELRALRREKKSLVTSENLVSSLLHMWNNRMLRTNARQHELVLHTFLGRYYESLAARARKKT